MARYRVMTWRGIPSQVQVRDDDRGRVSRILPDWFAQEIDRVAMREGLVGSDAYLAEWSWTPYVERPGRAPQVADEIVGELLAAWGVMPDA